MKNGITKDILIEDLVVEFPFSVEYLMTKGIRCIRCGEPTWGTLKSAIYEKGFDDTAVEQIVKELNDIAELKLM
jgi:hypothetical protein